MGQIAEGLEKEEPDEAAAYIPTADNRDEHR